MAWLDSVKRRIKHKVVLDGPGVQKMVPKFAQKITPKLSKNGPKIIQHVAGKCPENYREMTRKCSENVQKMFGNVRKILEKWPENVRKMFKKVARFTPRQFTLAALALHNTNSNPALTPEWEHNRRRLGPTSNRTIRGKYFSARRETKQVNSCQRAID